MISPTFARTCLADGQYTISAVLATSLTKAENMVADIKLHPHQQDARVFRTESADDLTPINLDGFAPELFDDLDHFLKADLDVVYLGSPNALHYEQARRALEAGKFVIVEKPAVTQDHQFAELVELAKKQGLGIVEAFRHLWDPNFALVKSELDKFDQITGASWAYRQYSSRYNAYKEGVIANTFKKELSGGAVFDIGVYLISSAVAWFGEPRAAQLFPQFLSTGVDANDIAVLSYSDFNVLCQISKNQASHQVCEFYDNSGNILSTDHVEALNWVKFNDQEVGKPKTRPVNLSAEVHAFPKLFRGDSNLTWTLEQLNQISILTHKVIAELFASV
jgi:predicted dehydrogenase